MNMFNFIKQMYDFAESKPEIIRPYHWALYITIIEKCNRLGWKGKFGLPTDQMMELSGIAHRKTYYKARMDLENFGFIKIVTFAKNHNSATIISLIQKYPVNARQTSNEFSEGNLSSSSSLQLQNLSDDGSALIIRPYKTSKDFIDNINNMNFCKNLLLKNKDLMEILAKKSAQPNLEIKLIDIFLGEKFASRDFLNWKDENDLFKHYMNWFSKQAGKDVLKNNIQKAERR